MLDKNGNKLLKPSPFKWIGAAISLGAGVIKAFSGGKAKKDAREKQKIAEGILSTAQGELKKVDTSNPWDDAANAINAYADLDNQMSGLDNVYDKQENVYTDMENKMKGQKNAFEGLENKFEGMENAFEDL